ncbi:fluoride efflux transporter FluC [Microbacterium stercoris]|uniref:Fluoride-specific ion channel FluC n=1 Tax=Microbacterium stercoris TaxID=2820289 RepID=A0A939QQP0_9MICO|nr:CrcB family protein [Microbacterium stercoris]MBO3662891.1 CrcB family protein [Microbacterium stercoris]
MRAPIRWGLLPLVFAGGVLGVALRAALTLPMQGGFTFGLLVATIGINAVGSGLLGFLVAGLGDAHPRRRAFLGTGVMGGFTTYSGFAVLLGELAQAGLILYAALFAALALLSAGAGAILGLQAGAKLARRRGIAP